MRSSLAGRLRPLRRGVDVDPVGDDLVVAAEPAATGPGGGLGDGDPRGEPVEDAARAKHRSDVVGNRLGRVGVEGADDRRAGAERGVPADQRHHRLVDVDYVVAPAGEARGAGATTPPAREGGEIGDGAVGAEADRAAQRHEVVGDLASLGGRAVQRPAEPVGRVEGSEHTDVVAAAEELLGERLDVPVYAALITPGIWRDKGDSHWG